MIYRKAAVGGTFDHFHAGHRQLLFTAFNTADTVVIGITHPHLSRDKTMAHLIEPYAKRLDSLYHFLQDSDLDRKADIVELRDPFGPTVDDSGIDALVVSQMTSMGADLVNRARNEKQLPSLPVIVTPMISDEMGEHISSTGIRTGKTTRNGRVFSKLFAQNIVFNEQQLSLLKSPQGEIYQGQPLNPSDSVFLVGDMVTKYFLSHDLDFSYAIVDGQSNRLPVDFFYPKLSHLGDYNQPGTINRNLAQELIIKFNQDPPRTVYKIEGEEDLLAFVPCLSLPLESKVLYGQPERGIVMITLTEAKKLALAKIIDPTFN